MSVGGTMKYIWEWLVLVTGWLAPNGILVQERFYEWRWEMHPMWWWGWGIGMMAMMFLFWARHRRSCYGVRRGHKWKRHLGMDRLLSRDWA